MFASFVNYMHAVCYKRRYLLIINSCSSFSSGIILPEYCFGKHELRVMAIKKRLLYFDKPIETLNFLTF